MIRPAIATFLVLALAPLAAAWQQPLFRSAVDIVRIDVSVMNGLAPVPGLTKDHFAIVDNGVPQTVESVSLDTVPLSLMLVLDTSGSLSGDRLPHLVDAANDLVRALKPTDQAGLLTFGMRIRQAVPMTPHRAPIVHALQGLTAEGSTSLNDAVFLALQLRAPNTVESRPVVLVFSDGDDSSSLLSGEEVLEATRRSGVVTHAVELIQMTPSRFLPDLAKAGGGRRWSARSSGDLNQLFIDVLNELRSRYLVTYSPTGVSRDGWHDVKVTVKNTKGEVTARPGYFAQSQ